MTRTTTHYDVSTRHDKWEPGNGIFRLTVHFEPIPEDQQYGGITGKRYVSGQPFGCSKTYFVATDREAIEMLLAEHATDLVDCQQAFFPPA